MGLGFLVAKCDFYHQGKPERKLRERPTTPTAGATGAYTPLAAVMAPVVDHLTPQGITQAVLIPTGLLGLLPLHAAWTPDATTPTGRRYALDSVTFRYAPSAMALAASQTQAQQTPATVKKPTTSAVMRRRWPVCGYRLVWPLISMWIACYATPTPATMPIPSTGRPFI